MIRKLAVPFALAAAFAMHDASAAFPTAQFQAKAKVNPNCTVTETGTLDFGNYDPLTANASAALAGSGASLSLLCTRGSSPSILMDNGVSGSGRQLVNASGPAGNNALTYDLLQPSALGSSATATAASWGATAATQFNVGVTTSSPTTPIVVEIFGTIPGGQDVATGTYLDTVTATVQF